MRQDQGASGRLDRQGPQMGKRREKRGRAQKGEAEDGVGKKDDEPKGDAANEVGGPGPDQ